MSKAKTYLRFPVAQRIEHAILVVTFGLLGITGLAQMFSQLAFSQWVLNLFGGISGARVVHHVCATILMLETLYHLVLAGYKVFVLKTPLTMLPGPKDAVDLFQNVAFNLGLRQKNAKMGRYNYAEKMEYWFMMWGLIVMGITGYMLWNPITTTKYLPGVVIPAAKMAHGWEAFLAVAAIIIWHFYHVHIKKFSMSMITGEIDHETMEEEHALELEQIRSGHTFNKPSAEVIKRRERVYIPIATLFSLVFLVLIYLFVNGEQTAIKTVPKQSAPVEVFVPQTPTPLPTMQPIPTTVAMPAGGDLTWKNGIGSLFAGKCGSCHGSMGGFSVATYADVMKGSINGVMVIAGDAEKSPLVVLQVKGNHMGNFTPEELETIKQWIAEGAKE